MRLRTWLWLALLAFLGGSLLRLGVETGGAVFTMFGMIAFLLIGLLALQEVSDQQARAGWRRLEQVLRRLAKDGPVLRLPRERGGGARFLVRGDAAWVALGVETSSEAGLWALVRPALASRARRLREHAASLPLGEGEAPARPVLVLVRRRVRARERALGERLGVWMINPEELRDVLGEGPAGAGPAARAGTAGAGGDVLPALARRLGAEAL